MKPFLTHPDHHTILTLPSRNVLLWPSRALPANLQDHKFIESLLIQSRGQGNSTHCEYCEKWLGLYAECRALQGWFGNACRNCKKNDWAARCTLSEVYKKDKEEYEEMQKLRKKEWITTRGGCTTRKPANYYG